MTDLANKPTHKEWRKAAKKARRKRIRQHSAELRKAHQKVIESSPSYQIRLEKERLLEEYEIENMQKEAKERHLKWLEDEEKAQKQWREEQKIKALALEEKIKEHARIREEWEKEQKLIREKKEKLEAIKKEEEKRRQEVLEKINEFISNGGDIPLELQTIKESNPGKELCTFFNKVGACRFGNQCSRNHQYYKISNVLMFVNFYTHFTLDQNKSSEYDTDIGLEFEDSEMYFHFQEFYNDIVPEFLKFGEVTMVRVCCNAEPHLRGNVYVEFKNERDALVAYRAFQGRWYGGKQLNIEFVKIKDWGSAVCGDFAKHRCPKGKSCNFLHVFRNPKNEYSIDWSKRTHNTNSSKNNFEDFDCVNIKKRNWRWSESPEISPKKYKSEKTKRRKSKSKSRDLVKKRKSSDLEDSEKKNCKKEKLNSNEHRNSTINKHNHCDSS